MYSYSHSEKKDSGKTNYVSLRKQEKNTESEHCISRVGLNPVPRFSQQIFYYRDLQCVDLWFSLSGGESEHVNAQNMKKNEQMDT